MELTDKGREFFEKLAVSKYKAMLPLLSDRALQTLRGALPSPLSRSGVPVTVAKSQRDMISGMNRGTNGILRRTGFTEVSRYTPPEKVLGIMDRAGYRIPRDPEVANDMARQWVEQIKDKGDAIGEAATFAGPRVVTRMPVPKKQHGLPTRLDAAQFQAFFRRHEAYESVAAERAIANSNIKKRTVKPMLGISTEKGFDQSKLEQSLDKPNNLSKPHDWDISQGHMSELRLSPENKRYAQLGEGLKGLVDNSEGVRVGAHGNLDVLGKESTDISRSRLYGEGGNYLKALRNWRTGESALLKKILGKDPYSMQLTGKDMKTLRTSPNPHGEHEALLEPSPHVVF